MTQAAEALAAGRAELARGDVAAAVRWLDRAARLAPGDLVVTMALGAACVAVEPTRAVRLFASVPAKFRPREAWWGLVAARLVAGDVAGAARDLAWVLAHFVMPAPLEVLAAAVVRAVGAAGWCGLGAHDRVVTWQAGTDGRVQAWLDRRPVALSRRIGTAGRALVVRADGMDLLGSPLRLDVMRRVDGYVEASGDEVRGWAWRPGDPDHPARITLSASGGGELCVPCVDAPPEAFGVPPLAQAGGFAVPVALLARTPPRGRRLGRLRVLAGERQALCGSPVDRDVALASRCRAAGAARRSVGPSRTAKRAPGVVVTVQGQPAAAEACVRAVLATTPAGTPVVVVDDAGADAGLRRMLRRFAAAEDIHLIRHRVRRGYAAAVEAGVAACPGRDLVLLDGTAVPAPGWIERLRAAADVAPEIGTMAPLSNDAWFAGYPDPAGANPVPDPDAAAWLADLAWRVHRARAVPAPFGDAGCLFVRRACWRDAGPFRSFPSHLQDGAAADFCLRTERFGWRHAVVPGVFVARHLAAGAGAVAAASREAARAMLARLHPDHAAEIAASLAADPLARARRRLDHARWEMTSRSRVPVVLLVTHADGGGVERMVAGACAAHRAAGRRPVVLRPAAGAGRGHAAVLEDAAPGAAPNLRFALPGEAGALLRRLRAENLVGIEVHHLLGHHPEVAALIAALEVPYDVQVHDYAWICPRVTLTRPVVQMADAAKAAPGGNEDRYCGEPDLAGCEACIAVHGSLLDEPIGVGALRQRSAALLHGARRVVMPSDDVAARLARHLPGLAPRIAPPEDDAALPRPPATALGRPGVTGGRVRVCVVGAIGPAKGVQVLLACAQDAARRNLPLEFVVVGPTTKDPALLATGRVFVTGPFQPEEAGWLIAAQGAHLGWLPSIWPETWCFALSDMWRAGLDVVAFDLGAPAERIRRAGRGGVLALGLPASRLNEMLLARAAKRVHLCAVTS
jgi:GT2 family glycosyltransferase/glycosyltransferase involved in cell wall biosynthesis